MKYRLLYLLCSVCGLLSAQNATSISGTVQDSQGASVSQARVRLFREGTGTIQRSVTTDSGVYRIEGITSGSFILEVEKDGFGGYTTSIQLNAGEQKTENIVLQLAEVNQSVVVTAAGAPQQLDEISKAISIVTAEEIQNRNEYSFSETIRNSPGILVTNSGSPGQNTNIRIRGLRPDATSILVDGIRFRDVSVLQSDASSVIPALNMMDVERVEILRGSGSSLYGTNAVGGVLNIVTREGGAPLHGQLQAETGNIGHNRGRGVLGGGAFKDRLKYTAGFVHLNIRHGVDGQDANRNTGGHGFVRYDFTPQMTLSARLWASDDFAQMNVSPSTTGIPLTNFPGSGVIPARPLSPENMNILRNGGTPDYTDVTLIPNQNDPDSRRGIRFYNSAFIFRHVLTPRVSWQSSYQRVHVARVYQDGPLGPGWQSPYWSRYVGDTDTADVRGTAQITSWLNLTGGYEFEREGYFDAQKNTLSPPDRIDVKTKIQQESHAGYFAGQLGLLDRKLQISFSGRAQAFRLGRPEFQLTGSASNYDRVQIQSPRKALTGDISIAYLLARSNTKFRAHLGNAYRAPSLYERFGGGFSANPITQVVEFSPYGDPLLLPDRYNSFDGGVDQYLLSNRVRISATAFYTRMQSLTAFDFSGAIQPDEDPYGRMMGYLNGSGGTSRGFELSIETRPLKSLTFNGSYTYTDAKMDQALTVPGFRRIFGVPRHMGTLVITKYWTSRIDTSVDLFHGSSYYNSFYAGFDSRAFQFPGFTKVDAVGNYRFWQGERQHARVYAKIENLFNQRYYQGGWLAPQATFMVGLGYSF